MKVAVIIRVEWKAKDSHTMGDDRRCRELAESFKDGRPSDRIDSVLCEDGSETEALRASFSNYLQLCLGADTFKRVKDGWSFTYNDDEVDSSGRFCAQPPCGGHNVKLVGR